jgi:hypothetical protein
MTMRRLAVRVHAPFRWADADDAEWLWRRERADAQAAIDKLASDKAKANPTAAARKAAAEGFAPAAGSS